MAETNPKLAKRIQEILDLIRPYNICILGKNALDEKESVMRGYHSAGSITVKDCDDIVVELSRISDELEACMSALTIWNMSHSAVLCESTGLGLAILSRLNELKIANNTLAHFQTHTLKPKSDRLRFQFVANDFDPHFLARLVSYLACFCSEPFKFSFAKPIGDIITMEVFLPDVFGEEAKLVESFFARNAGKKIE